VACKEVLEMSTHMEQQAGVGCLVIKESSRQPTSVGDSSIGD